MQRIRAAVLALAFSAGIAAQTFQLGSSSDPCTGGTTWASPPLRYGNFTCTFPAAAPGLYLVTLNFQEPNVTQIGGRIFNATVQGTAYPSVQRLDLVAAGASSSSTIISRTVPALSDGKIQIQLTTLVRNAVLASVRITQVPTVGPPGPAGPKGDKGDKGDAGPPGPPGQAGTSIPTQMVSGSLKCPASAASGDTVTCTVSLNQPAPAGGFTISPYSAICNNAPSGSLPPSPCSTQPVLSPAILTVPAGASTGSFQIQIP